MFFAEFERGNFCCKLRVQLIILQLLAVVTSVSLFSRAGRSALSQRPLTQILDISMAYFGSCNNSLGG
jgi:hypothetical protein